MIYADYNATTPCLPAAAEATLRCLTTDFGNASSRHYPLGRSAAALREAGRQKLATALGCYPDELSFCSGATEAINHIIIGVFSRLAHQRPVICIAATEHPAVWAAAEQCAAAGAAIRTLPVDGNGCIAAKQLHLIDERCCLVVAMAANNETGVLHDLAPIAARAHHVGALLASDCTQALGKLPCTLHAWQVDFAVVSGHKCYAPKGIGALYKKRGLSLDPHIAGGGQENGLRGGTENIPALHGWATALDHICRPEHYAHLAACTEQLETILRATIPTMHIFGSQTVRMPGTTFCAVPGNAAGWLQRVPQLCVSPGSSCASSSNTLNRCLTAMGVDDDLARNALRISFGAPTTPADVTHVAQALHHGLRL